MGFRLFSQRNNYTKVSDIIIREAITPELQNVICSNIDNLERALHRLRLDGVINFDFEHVELKVWTDFFNQRHNNFYCGFQERKVVVTSHILDPKVEWYSKLDILEFVIHVLRGFCAQRYQDQYYQKVVSEFIEHLNYDFTRLNYAYRIVNYLIVEITSEQEIKAIENALHDNQTSVRMHLDNALKLYSRRPNPDPRNSIKESISAVEAFCREQTGEETLGKALKHLVDNGILIHKMLNESFTKLYVYTNDKASGIRHALMDADAGYTPSLDEAYYMIVTCSAFINFLNMKLSR